MLKTRWLLMTALAMLNADLRAADLPDIRATDYPSIQAAVDANPGRMIFIPSGDHPLDAPIDIRTDNTGLYGHGKLIQTNPDAAVINVRDALGTRVEGLTLTRLQDKTETHREAVFIARASHFRIADLRILDNHSDNAAIRVEASHHGRIAACDIRNYKRIGVDDRTASPLYGYAFRAIVGDGIVITTSTHLTITDNAIIENRIRSDEAAKAQFKLGQLTEGRAPTKKGKFAPTGDVVPHWHQGSAIVVTSPEQTRHVIVTGNLIQNAAQGVDIHADHVTFADNVIDTAFVGIKCMHGSRNVIIAGNNVSNTDLWGLIMQPGTASHPATGDRPPNATRANLIANNVFTNVGFGQDFHNWKGSDSRNVLQFEAGPLPENPPLADVVIQGNVVDATTDQFTETDPAPRYNHALYIDPRIDIKTFKITGNLFHPGARGITNRDITP
jgi:hypothetical protein